MYAPTTSRATPDSTHDVAPTIGRQETVAWQRAAPQRCDPVAEVTPIALDPHILSCSSLFVPLSGRVVRRLQLEHFGNGVSRHLPPCGRAVQYHGGRWHA